VAALAGAALFTVTFRASGLRAAAFLPGFALAFVLGRAVFALRCFVFAMIVTL